MVEVMHVDEVALTLFKRASRSLDKRAEIVLAFRDASDFDDLHRDGQLGSAQNLVDRVIDVIYQACHQNSQHVVVLYLVGIGRCAKVHLGHVAHKLDDCFVIYRASNLDRSQSALVAIQQLLLTLYVWIYEVSSH